MARILVVDDDPDIVDSVRLFLEQDGHEVASASNRDDGMGQVKSFKPDLLILDVMMEQPDDGIAMAQELRRQAFTAPILLLTSISKATGSTYGKDEEMVPVDAFQEKPVVPEKLVALVKELLSK
ncbi:MAG TPA: response regulator [Candidatus Hydrogenedentes bacterium]|nr:response regulator [Candidatus Hydrogenedentota bacterium]HPG67549.1 response regulator [Candidatus Hydrogenedentota bacterium]